MEDIFYVLDADGSGTISQEEIEELAKGNEKVKAEIKNLLSQGDVNGDNEFTKEEFMSIVKKWQAKGLSNDYILKHMQALEEKLIELQELNQDEEELKEDEDREMVEKDRERVEKLRADAEDNVRQAKENYAT